MAIMESFLANDFFLAFIFVLAIVYGALDITKVLSKRPSLLIAAVMALFAASNETSAAFVKSVFPFAVIFFIVIFFLAFISSLFKKGGEKDFDLIAILLALVLLALAAFQNTVQGWQITQEMVAAIALAAMLIIFFVAYRRSKE